MEENLNYNNIKNFFKFDLNTPLQKIEENFINEKNISLYIKRDDLIHPFINGNKWYKLKYNLIEASELGLKNLLTFGGAYSNHIYAFSYACKTFGFNGIVVIRGEEYKKLNPTLEFVSNCGVSIQYFSQSKYKFKYSEDLLYKLNKLYGDYYLIPEGGSNKLAVKGCEEITSNINCSFDYVITACGTAGTLTGITKSLKSNQKAIGISVLKNGNFLYDEVNKLSEQNLDNYKIKLNYHFGGYAKFNDDLIDFIRSIYSKHNIILEPIYTGKVLFAVYDLISKNFFKSGSTIVVYHSGGLQGYQGLLKYQKINQLFKIFNWSEYEKCIIKK